MTRSTLIADISSMSPSTTHHKLQDLLARLSRTPSQLDAMAEYMSRKAPETEQRRYTMAVQDGNTQEWAAILAAATDGAYPSDYSPVSESESESEMKTTQQQSHSPAGAMMSTPPPSPSNTRAFLEYYSQRPWLKVPTEKLERAIQIEAEKSETKDK